MPQKPASEQVWNVLGEVREQSQLGPGVVMITVSVPLPVEINPGNRTCIQFFFDRIVLNRHKMKKGFDLLIRRAELRFFGPPTFKLAARLVILDCVPFESGNRKRVFKLGKGNAVLGEP